MPIGVACVCGWSAGVHETYAGKRVRCPKCGAVVAVPPWVSAPAPPPRGPGILHARIPGCLGCLGLCVVGLVVMMVAFGGGGGGANRGGAGRAVSEPRLGLGDVGRLGYQDGSPGVIWVASADEDWDAMIDAQVDAARGGPGAGVRLSRLVASGRVLALPTGTAVRIVGSGMFSRQVLLLDGEYSGREGWVQVELVRPGPLTGPAGAAGSGP
jgi:hypothetical protein